MSDSEIKYLSDKIHIHRWPQDSPVWDDFTQKQLDDSINKNKKNKLVSIKENIIQIENIQFFSLKKIGISVPFFKDECTIIFEAQFGKLYAHVHITIKSKNYVDVFNQLISWRDRVFAKDS